MLYDICQLTGGLILALGWVPQIVRMIRTRSVEDLSAGMLMSVLTGIALMEVYALHLASSGVGLPFLITNTLSFIFVGTTFVLYLICRGRTRQSRR